MKSGQVTALRNRAGNNARKPPGLYRFGTGFGSQAIPAGRGGAESPQPRRFSFIKLQRIRVGDSFVDDMRGVEIAYVLSWSTC